MDIVGIVVVVAVGNLVVVVVHNLVVVVGSLWKKGDSMIIDM